MFGDRHLSRMEQITRDVCRDFEAELIEFNGENNHVHLQVNYPPKVAVARLVNSLKGVSSRRLRQEFPDLIRHYYRANKSGRARTSRAPSQGHRFKVEWGRIAVRALVDRRRSRRRFPGGRRVGRGVSRGRNPRGALHVGVGSVRVARSWRRRCRRRRS
ncbi:hypothetical protein B0E53_00315 [Micromonospora sp. MH33]|nr:hypothetical protein B0E53_00315 [Micromonospora sp. MH33]